MSVMGFADKNIRKPEDIKGKTVAVTPGDSMSQIWPLFLKKTNLKETDFKTVAGDAQNQAHAVINNQADLLLGYPMDRPSNCWMRRRSRSIQSCFAEYGVQHGELRIIVQKDVVKNSPPRQALHARGNALA